MTLTVHVTRVIPSAAPPGRSTPPTGAAPSTPSIFAGCACPAIQVSPADYLQTFAALRKLAVDIFIGAHASYYEGKAPPPARVSF
jgi:hypothetical protein